MITKQQVKNEQIKFQENKLKIVWKNFSEIKIILIRKKRFLAKAIGHNDHDMINMGSQRLKIDGSWPLTGPYLQPFTLVSEWVWESVAYGTI